MALDDDIRDLSRAFMFRELDVEALRLIAFAAPSQTYVAGDVLFEAGEVSESGFLLREGSLTLTAGLEHMTLAPPSFIGDMALLSPTQRTATAIVSEASLILEVPRSLFLRVLNEYPASAVRLHHKLAARLQTFAGELEAARAAALE